MTDGMQGINALPFHLNLIKMNVKHSISSFTECLPLKRG